ncbi:MAG: DUF4290 domain-containing protein [Bacteroidetes bacterium]|nr:MAG: DUF4290 domain-containing protein [Bacteroidota bacterium]
MEQSQKLAARERMEYNSSRSKLIISEYGRHVQKMIAHARTIEDNEDRQFFMEEVVELMGQMQPGIKSSPEFTNKLWNHAYMIASYDIELDVPEGVVIAKMTERKHPPKLPYPLKNMKYRHYGHNVQVLIDKAGKMEDSDKKEVFSNAIGSYMKLAYKTWNRDHYVNDEVIKGDLRKMSGNDLDLDESVQLNFLQSTTPAKQQYPKKRSNSHHKNRSKGGRQKRRR